jgi:hypothetical protein
LAGVVSPSTKRRRLEDPIAQLMPLKAAFDAGALTEEEFVHEKRQILELRRAFLAQEYI